MNALLLLSLVDEEVLWVLGLMIHRPISSHPLVPIQIVGLDRSIVLPILGFSPSIVLVLFLGIMDFLVAKELSFTLMSIASMLEIIRFAFGTIFELLFLRTFPAD